MKMDDGSELRIVILGLTGCPNLESTIEMVKRAVTSLDQEAQIASELVGETDDFPKIGFRGSPTVLINGVDIEGNDSSDDAYVFGCRIYGTSGTPPQTMIETAILAAVARR